MILFVLVLSVFNSSSFASAPLNNNKQSINSQHTPSSLISMPTAIVEISSIKSNQTDWKKVVYAKANSLKVKAGRPIVTAYSQAPVLAGKPKVTVLSLKKQIITASNVPLELPLRQTIDYAQITKQIYVAESIEVLGLKQKDDSTDDIRYLSVAQGLPSGSIYSIYYDNDNKLWLGTNGAGVCQYDGVRLRCFNESNGLSNNRVWQTVQDSVGNFWFATDRGATRFDGVTFAIFTKEQGLADNKVNKILVASDGTIWFATDNGLSRFDGKVMTTYGKDSGLPDSKILSLYEDNKQIIWIGTEKAGVSRFDGNRFTHLNQEMGLCRGAISAIEQDTLNRMWFASHSDGVCYYDGEKIVHFTTKQGLIDNKITAIHVNKNNGDIWFGTDGSGIVRFDGKYFTTTNKSNGLSSLYIRDIIQDDFGNLWVATYTNGINKVPLSSFKIHNINTGLANLRISALMADEKDNVWLGTFGDGVAQFDGDFYRQFTTKQGLVNDIVHAIIEDSKGNIWFATRGGVSKFDGEYFTNYTTDDGLAGNMVHALLEDSAGRIWFATRSGISQFDGEKFTSYFNQKESSNNWFFSIAQDDSNNLWFASNREGVYKFDGKYFYHIDETDGLANNWVYAIQMVGTDQVWFGTRKGISILNNRNKLAKPEHFQNISTAQGLSSNIVLSFVEAVNKDLWVGTENGINKISLANVTAKKSTRIEPEEFKIRSFLQSKGDKILDVSLNTAIRTKNNKLLWGSSVGLVELDLNSYHHRQTKPKIEISGISLAGQDINYLISEKSKGKQIEPIKYNGLFKTNHFPIDLELSHSLNDIAFDYVAIDWQAPERLRYQIRLLGWNDDWKRFNEHNSVEYQNLPPGQYEFNVRAVNVNGIISKVNKYAFTIHPPWWETWWAYFIFASSFIVAVFLGFQMRFKRINQRQRAFQKAKMNAELIIRKNEMFAHVSHEFRTPLTLVLGPINNLLKKVKSKEEKRSLSMASLNAKRLLRMVDQLLDLAKLDNLAANVDHNTNVSLVVGQLYMSLLTLFEEKKITTNIKIADHLFANIQHDAAEKIIINLITNAIKYTKQGGMVEINCYRENQMLHLSITDNGIGIAEQDLERIFERFVRVHDIEKERVPGAGIGLALVKELVERYNGTMQVESELGKGTCFTVCFPLLSAIPHLEEISVINEDYVEQEKTILEQEKTILEQGYLNINENAKTVAEFEAEIPSKLEASNSSITSLTNKPIVLIVEDHPEMQAYIAEGLSLDFNCLLANDGNEGIKLAMEVIPDLIITDLMMPNRNGYELARLLRQEMKTAHIPIVMLTAKGDDESRMEAWKTDIDEYICKPFDQDELSLRVRNLLNIRLLISQRIGQRLNSLSNFTDSMSEEAVSSRLVGVSDKDKRFMNQLDELLALHFHDPELKAELIYPELAMSERQFHRKMKALLAQTFSDYLRTFRLGKGALLLKQNLPVTQVAMDCGFSTQSYFSRCFKAQYCLSPKQYAQQGKA